MPGIGAARAKMGESFWRNANVVMNNVQEAMQARTELGQRNADRIQKAGLDAMQAETQMENARREKIIAGISMAMALVGGIMAFVDLCSNSKTGGKKDITEYLKANKAALDALVQSLTTAANQYGQLKQKEAEEARARKQFDSADAVLDAGG